ncbi:MAG: penicillin-binding protein [Bacteroidaceae bacterium]|nr:penicillin-binding protein [Bacteroidaceae bacterium]
MEKQKAEITFKIKGKTYKLPTRLAKLLYPIFVWLKKWAIKYKTAYRTGRWYKKLAIIIGTVFASFFIYLGAVDMNFLWLFGKSPTLQAIANPEQAEASTVYSADGKVLGHFFRENRMPVKFEEIPPILIKTLICTEDERFYSHFGVDVQGLFSAAKDMAGGNARGASTITQQLVKNMFNMRSQYSRGVMGYIPGLRMLITKTKEWITAIKLEIFYKKDEILTMYLNTVDFGSSSFGIKSAAKTYYMAEPKDLTIDQCAVLVGLLKATTYYNPRSHPENALERRNVVLKNLLDHKGISLAQYNELKDRPIKLKYNITHNYDGTAQYFREALAEELSSWCKENQVDLYGDGLKIYTTLDTRMQEYAEAAVKKQMRIVQRGFNQQWGNQDPWEGDSTFIERIVQQTEYYKILAERFGAGNDSIDYFLNLPHSMKIYDLDKGEKEVTMSTIDSLRYMQHILHTGFVAMEPQTGYIKAWVGDIDFEHWKYDKVRSRRQPGSTFKLFVYTTAMNQGMSPCDTWQDKDISWPLNDGTFWAPHNASGGSSGATMSLKAAMARSVNTIAAAVGQEVGINNIIQTAHAMGIKSRLARQPSICLGSSDVSPLELINSYCTAVDDGVANDPVFVLKIEDKDGNVIYEHKPAPRQAIPYESAFLMQQMLQAGMTEPGGTSQALWSYNLQNYDTNFGGKTGTTSGHSDCWFVGVTPKLVAGAWVGGEYRSVHFRNGSLGQGSHTALPIFAFFMEKVLADKRLTRYRGKFATEPKHPIDRDWKCQTAYQPAENDTLNSDSILFHLDNVKADEEDIKDVEPAVEEATTAE